MTGPETGRLDDAGAVCRRLVDISIAAAAEPELSALLERVLAEARSFTRAEAGTIFLREGDRLRFAAVHNDVLTDELGATEMRRRLGNVSMTVSASSLVGYVAATGQVLRVPDVDAIPPGAPYAFDRSVDRHTTYRTRSVLAVPLVNHAGESLGVLELMNARDARAAITDFAPERVDLVRCLAAQATLSVRAALLEELSYRDPLTNLYNRRYFALRVQEEGRRHERFAEPLSLVLIDIDHFKPVNDRLGHAAGDALLRELGQLLARHSRSFSVITRYGGDEFAVLLANTAKEGAVAYARRIKALVEAHPFAHGSLTISLGVSCLPDDVGTSTDLIAAADRALYLAKRAGRNGVEVA
jgi:diguanylate cyclase (GGDEF)-like protein